MKLIINDVKNGFVTFEDIVSFNYCGSSELTIVFKTGHKYSSMEEIIDKLQEAGLIVGNFYFKGITMWNYEAALDEMKTYGTCVFDENGETSVICIIPENIRDTFKVFCCL